MARPLLEGVTTMKTCRPPRLSLLLALGLAAAAPMTAACGADEDDSSGGPDEGGKADDLGATCSFDTPSPLGDTSEDLAEAIAGSVRVSSSTELSALEEAQLVAAAVHLGMAQPGVSVRDVFAISDDGEFDIIDLEFEGLDPFVAADWVSFFAGDNEVGVVFADGTADVIAEISDGDVMHCAPAAPETTCTFDTPSPLGDTSEDLAEAIAGSVRVSSTTELSALEEAQLTAAVVQLGMADEGVAVADVFQLSDDGEFDVIDLEVEGDPFIAADWISFFAGDNEVGVVFADGSTDVIAQISDGDVMHCE